MMTFARDYFAARRGNCAESVAAAWADRHPDLAVPLANFSKLGGGRAPEGMCGALFASCRIAGPELAEKIRTKFQMHSGGPVACRSIRAARTLRCAECVELSAALLDQATRPTMEDAVP